MDVAKGPEIAYRAEPREFAKGQLAQLEDQRLVERALAGQDLAFEVLMERYLPIVTGFLAAKTHSLADAEDLAQEVFLVAYRSLAQLNTPERFRAWLMRIMHSRLIDYYRAASRRPQMVSGEADPERPDDEGLLAHLREPSASPGEQAAAGELRGIVLREIAGMDEKYRSILYLRLVGEQSSEEIGRALGLNASSVRMRLFRGIRLLRKMLKRFEIG